MCAPVSSRVYSLRRGSRGASSNSQRSGSRIQKPQGVYCSIYLYGNSCDSYRTSSISDCTTAAFLATYKRFCARRGIPSFMYSDNATTFRGAQRELAEAWRKATRDPNLLAILAENGVTWRFLPPTAPYFGSLWEAGVRSIKYHLKRVVGTHTLTFEEMVTFLCQIEACLNSRTIAPSSDKGDDYFTLTPVHFLIGSSLTAIPELTFLDVNDNRLSRWQIISYVIDFGNTGPTIICIPCNKDRNGEWLNT